MYVLNTDVRVKVSILVQIQTGLIEINVTGCSAGPTKVLVHTTSNSGGGGQEYQRAHMGGRLPFKLG